MIEIPTIKLETPEEFNFAELHDKYKVDLNKVIKQQPIAISIGEHRFASSLYPTPVCSYGDFSCIVGASKSKKTFFKSLMTACYIGGNSVTYSDFIKGHQTQGKYVIDIDTEQSEYHSQKVFKRVEQMIGAPYKGYIPFAIRKLSPNERLGFINWLLTESVYKSNIGLVLIDGVADLVNDTNNLEESNNVTQKLLSWSAEANCHIITILHRNFGSNKPVGHLGSSILKKAETVIFVEKQDEVTKVSGEYTRNMPFNDFAFKLTKEWLPTTNDIDFTDNSKNEVPF